MKTVVGFDLETALIQHGLKAPPMVVASINGVLTHVKDAKPVILKLLQSAANGEIIIVGHNIAFDMGVICSEWSEFIPLVFDAYDADGITDTMLREKLIRIAHGINFGGYSLGALCSSKYHDIAELDKSDDSWRLRYYDLIRVPLGRWPAAARDYAEQDTIVLKPLYQAQAKASKYLQDEFRQARSAFALHLMAAWGMRTDPEAVYSMKDALVVSREGLILDLKECGIMRDNGSVNTSNVKALVEKYHANPATTDKGAIKTSVDILEECDSDELRTLVKYRKNTKKLTTYIPQLLQGITLPVQPYVHTILETGRVSMSSPALMTMPKKGGLRECFVPRSGSVFCAVDYDTAEVKSHAQTLIDMGIKSQLITMMQDPEIDIHSWFAATSLLGISYEEGMRRKAAGDADFLKSRQGAKSSIFGFPANMGVELFLHTNSFLGWSEHQAKRVKDQYTKAFNMKEYWTMMSRTYRLNGNKMVTHRSKRWRGDIEYKKLMNYGFQPVTSDGAKAAFYETAKKMYARPENVLYGARNVLFMHDEIIAEVPESGGHECSQEISETMISSMMKFTPDIPATTEAVLMKRWSKDAKPKFENGRLIA